MNFRLPTIVLMTCLVATSAAFASCVDAQDWLAPPSGDLQLVVEPPQRPPFDFGGATSNGSRYAARPLALDLKQLQEDSKPTLPAMGGHVAYYESDGHARWRLCRLETWAPSRKRTPGTTRGTHPSAARFADAGLVALVAKLYVYDAQGRVVQRVDAELAHGQAEVENCLRYDEQDRVVLSVQPTFTHACPRGNAPPDPRDAWNQFAYTPARSESDTLLERFHEGRPDGSWVERTGVARQGLGTTDAFIGLSRADSVHGVTRIEGSNYGKLDDNVSNTVVDAFGKWRGSSYFFSQGPDARKVLENPDLIYQHARRRVTLVDGSQVKLEEYFGPGEHVSRHRYYLIGGEVARHEQFDAGGKLTRVVTLEGWKQPRPGPHPTIDDKQLTDHGVRLVGHEIYHRVYDVDAAGQAHLVALSWNRRTRLSASAHTPMDLADVVYGTPDGQVRWKSREAFEGAFDTYRDARQVLQTGPSDAPDAGPP